MKFTAASKHGQKRSTLPNLNLQATERLAFNRFFCILIHLLQKEWIKCWKIIIINPIVMTLCATRTGVRSVTFTYFFLSLHTHTHTLEMKNGTKYIHEKCTKYIWTFSLFIWEEFYFIATNRWSMCKLRWPSSEFNFFYSLHGEWICDDAFRILSFTDCCYT